MRRAADLWNWWRANGCLATCALRVRASGRVVVCVYEHVIFCVVRPIHSSGETPPHSGEGGCLTAVVSEEIQMSLA